MNLARTARWLLLAFAVSLVPAISHAGVFISVGFAPPPLLVYEQPLCPEPGWIWTPGYWAYGDDGYYWVPGTWVPAPYEGALWTPGYWGWNAGLYMWHPGYWGPHVGYYGGVNYGYGYMGVGFVGGRWHGHVFEYNTAVMHVDRHVIRNVYEDRRIVEHNTIVNDRHVAFSGGPGGIRHDPDRDERRYMGERHMEATSYQTQHRDVAMHDRNAYFNNNHGRPDHVVAARPLGYNNHGAPDNRNGYQQNRGGENPMGGRNQVNRPNEQGQQHGRPQQYNNQPQYNNHGGQPQNRPQQYNNPPQYNNHGGQPQNRPQQNNNQQRPNQNWQQHGRPQPFNNQERPNNNQNMQQQRNQQERMNQRPQARPQPESRPEPRPQERPQPQNEGHGHGR